MKTMQTGVFVFEKK